jgi:hypothetical protein
MKFAKIFEPPVLGQVLVMRTVNEKTFGPSIHLYHVIDDGLLVRRVRDFPNDMVGVLARNLAFDAMDEAEVVRVLTGTTPTVAADAIIIDEAGHA